MHHIACSCTSHVHVLCLTSYAHVLCLTSHAQVLCLTCTSHAQALDLICTSDAQVSSGNFSNLEVPVSSIVLCRLKQNSKPFFYSSIFIYKLIKARGHSPLHTGKYFNFTFYISAQSLIFNFRCSLFKRQTYSVFFLRANSCLTDQSIRQFALS